MTIAGSEAMPIASRPASGGLRILLAEDQLVNQKVVQRMLTLRGHVVVLAANGAQAVEAQAREPFDVILMDVEMPGMDGLHATLAIRARELPRGTHTPIIALTAHALREDVERCRKAGMDDHLCKPLVQEELLAALERWRPSTAEPGAGGPQTAT